MSSTTSTRIGNEVARPSGESTDVADLRRGQVEPNEELTSLARTSAQRVHRSAVHVHERAHERQADAEAALRARDRDDQLLPRRVHERFARFDGAANDGRELDALFAQLDLATRYARDLEQVVHEP